MKILKQWENYIEKIHYKIFLKNKSIKLNLLLRKQKNKLKNYEKNLKEIKKITFKKIAEINSISKKDDDKIIMLYSKPMYKPKINLTLLRKLFWFDGYIFYGDKGNNWTLYKIKDLDIVYNLVEKKESYNLIDKIGTMNNKPLFIIKYPFAISLSINDEYKLYYDAKSYYNYVNYATKRNILNRGEEGGFIGFLKKHFLVIIIVIILVIILSTPQGQLFFKDLINKISNGGK